MCAMRELLESHGSLGITQLGCSSLLRLEDWRIGGKEGGRMYGLERARERERVCVCECECACGWSVCLSRLGRVGDGGCCCGCCGRVRDGHCCCHVVVVVVVVMMGKSGRAGEGRVVW